MKSFYNYLAEIGTSIQVGEGEGMYRMHIHVPLDKRYTPIDYIMGIGTVTKVSMENLVAQIEPGKPARQQFYPSQCCRTQSNRGSCRLTWRRNIADFASLGVAAIVQGGQTMNPSTEEILQAFENLPTDKIVILPDNKNIIMAAQSAATMTVKRVAVIPTKSVPQGLNAMLRMNPEGDFDHVVKDMTTAISEVDSGEITIATRNVEINGVTVHEGEVIAILNGNVVLAVTSIVEACLGLLEKAHTEERERITLFYGEKITKNDVNIIVDRIREVYPSHEIELHEGGQPHYHFIVAIE